MSILQGRGDSVSSPPQVQSSCQPLTFLLAASTISGLGDGIASSAFPLLASLITQDPRAVAAIFGLQNVPWLLSLPLGAWADRCSARGVMIGADMFRAAALLILIVALWAGERSIVALGVTVLLIGIGDVLFYAGSMTLIPALAPATELAATNGRLVALRSASEDFGGSALGGWMFSRAVSLPLVGDLLSFVSSALLLKRVPKVPPAAQATNSDRPTLRQDVVEAFRFFREDVTLRSLAWYLGVLAFSQAIVLSVLVLYATQQLGLGAGGFGLYLGGGAVGSTCGALAASWIWQHGRTAHVLLLAGQLAACSFAVSALVSSPWVASFALFAQSVAVALASVITTTYRQRFVPARMLGRVNNLFRSILFGVAPFGALLAGLLVSAYGIPTTFAVAAGISLFAVVVMGPQLWRVLPATGRELGVV